MGFKTNWQVCVFDPSDGKPHQCVKFDDNYHDDVSQSASNGYSSNQIYTTSPTVTTSGSFVAVNRLNETTIELKPGDIVYLVAYNSGDYSMLLYHYKTHSFFSMSYDMLPALRPILIEQDAIEMELKHNNSVELEVHLNG